MKKNNSQHLKFRKPTDHGSPAADKTAGRFPVLMNNNQEAIMRNKATAVFVIFIGIFIAASLVTGISAKAGVYKLDSIADKYAGVKFDHEKHSKLAGNCGACHHQHGNSASLPCKECHSLTPENFRNSVNNMFMACKNCHSVTDPANPGMPGLKVAYHRTCMQCHRGMGNVGTDPKGCTEMCHAKKGN